MIYRRFGEIFSGFDPSQFSSSQLILEFLSITDLVKDISSLTFRSELKSDNRHRPSSIGCMQVHQLLGLLTIEQLIKCNDSFSFENMTFLRRMKNSRFHPSTWIDADHMLVDTWRLDSENSI